MSNKHHHFGGRTLARAQALQLLFQAEATDRTVYEVLEATEGTLAAVACLGPDAGVCEREASCKTLPMWQGLERLITGYLTGITLEDIVEGRIPDITEG